MSTLGASRLDTWIREERGRGATLADTLRVRPQAVSQWRAGMTRPSRAYRSRIERLTGGAVAATAWDVAAKVAPDRARRKGAR